MEADHWEVLCDMIIMPAGCSCRALGSFPTASTSAAIQGHIRLKAWRRNGTTTLPASLGQWRSLPWYFISSGSIAAMRDGLSVPGLQRFSQDSKLDLKVFQK